MKNLLDRVEFDMLNNPETTFLGKLKNVVCGAVLYLIWSYIVLYLMETFIPEVLQTHHSISSGPPPTKLFIFLGLCIMAPLSEEIYFRLPYSLIKHIPIRRVMLFSVLLSSVIFGSLHMLGRYSIPVQGVAGLIFSYVYLKNGYSYWSSVACHFCVNFSIFFYYYILK